MHFTHVDHLRTIVDHGLLCDAAAQSSGLLTAEVGNVDIKRRRRARVVPVPPGGVVADYVPFYFAARSPMMYLIAHGGVDTYDRGASRLIYLVSSLERLHDLGHATVLTDRNAVLNYAEFRPFNPADPIDDGFIDWPLMRAQYWNATTDDPQRKERRMAEALVHHRVGWDAILGIGVKNDVIADEVRRALTAAGAPRKVNVVPHWYF